YLHAFGTVQLVPASIPVSPKTVMWLASCSKLVTSVAVLQCLERGLFALDSTTDVERLLPEWGNRQIITGFENGQAQLRPAEEKFTLRRLLTHSSGMCYDFIPPVSSWKESCGGQSEALSAEDFDAYQHPLAFEPGTGFSYGTGVDLAGLMVARANGCTLEEYMREHIFDPLGMGDTTFRLRSRADLVERLMPMTSRLPDGSLSNEDSHPYAMDAREDFGGKGLFGTAEDYLKLLKSLARDDGRLLKSETIEMMFEPALSPSSQAKLDGLLSTDQFAAIAIGGGERALKEDGSSNWSHGLVSLIGLSDSPKGFKGPWLRWGGAPNLKWWIDRKGGSCGIYATQLNPPGDSRNQPLADLFQEEMARRFKKEA
ncbi:beta-lactamase/transpeptidase-like protein, partial [Polyplosphaeria fusca]